MKILVRNREGMRGSGGVLRETGPETLCKKQRICDVRSTDRAFRKGGISTPPDPRTLQDQVILSLTGTDLPDHSCTCCCRAG